MADVALLWDDEPSHGRLGLLIHASGSCRCGRPFNCTLATAIMNALREGIEAAGVPKSGTAPAMEKGKPSP